MSIFKHYRNRKQKLKTNTLNISDIHIIDLDKELNVNINEGESCKDTEIPLHYINEVENMNKEIDNEIKKIESKMKKDNIKLKDFSGKEQKRKIQIIFITLLMLFPIIYVTTNYLFNMNKSLLFTEEQKVDYSGTILNVSMNKESGMLNYEPEHLTIKISDTTFLEISKEQIDNWNNTELYVTDNTFEVDGEEYNISNNLKLSTLDCYDDFMYITYMNDEHTGIREIITSAKMPNSLDLGEMTSVDSRVFESNSALYVKSFLNSYNDSFLFYADSIAGGELGTKTLVSRLYNLENSLNYSESDSEEVTIKFKGMNNLELSKISSLADAPGIYLSNNDGVLRLYNYELEIPYIFITYLNNATFMCNATDLIDTNYENLFITKGFDDPESVGYRTFALIGGNNIYVFRVASEAPETLLTELLEQFGIDRNNIEVKVVQSVVNVEDLNKTQVTSMINENEIEQEKDALIINSEDEEEIEQTSDENNDTNENIDD